MKKKIRNIVLVLIVISTIACNQDSISSLGVEQQDELKLTNLDFDLDINFEPQDIIFDFKDGFEAQKTEALVIIDTLNEGINYRVENDDSFFGIAYTITITDDKLTISKWKFIADVTSNKEYTGDYGMKTEPDNDGWSCPEGTSEIARCWSRNSVTDAIDTFLHKSFEEGDSVQIVVHHGGWTGGATVCAGHI